MGFSKGQRVWFVGEVLDVDDELQIAKIRTDTELVTAVTYDSVVQAPVDRREGINAALGALTSALRERYVDTRAMSTGEWNAHIAPLLSQVAMAVDGTTVTARTFRLPEDYFYGLSSLESGGDDYVGWARYGHRTDDPSITTIEFCDSDAPGAFRVYRHAEPVVDKERAAELLKQVRDRAGYFGENGSEWYELRDIMRKDGYPV